MPQCGVMMPFEQQIVAEIEKIVTSNYTIYIYEHGKADKNGIEFFT